MFNSFKWFWLSLSVLLLVACGGDDDDSGSDGEQAGAASVRLMPVAARAPGLSIMVDADTGDDVAATRLADLTYGQLATFSLASGSAMSELAVRYSVPDGATLGRTYEDAMEPIELQPEADVRYDFFFAGSYPDAESWMVQMPRQFEEREDQARLTLVNAAANMEGVDVHLTPVGSAISSSTLLANLGYGDIDHSLRLDPGTYEVQVAAAGSAESVYRSDSITVAAGNDLSLVVLENTWIKQDFAGKPPVVLNFAGATGGSRLMYGASSGAELRVVHASSDAGLVDVIVGSDANAPFAEDFALGEVTEYQSVDSGVHRFQVVAANGSDGPIDTNLNLFNGVAWTIYILRPWADMDPLLTPDNARPIDAYARLRVVQGSSQAERVDIWLTPPGADLNAVDASGNPVHTPVLQGYTTKAASGYFAVEAGTYDLTFTRTVGQDETAPDEPEIVYGPVEVSLANGEVSSLLLRDTAEQVITHQWVEVNEPAPETEQ